MNHNSEIQQKNVENVEKSNEQLQPIDSLDGHELNERPTYNSNYLLLLMGFGLLFYFALKRRWLQQVMPRIVWVSLKIKRIKSSKSRLARMAVVNKTTDSITLQPPVLVFGSPFKKSRKFRIKNNADNVFPLTLTPNTSHGITIDITQFRRKAGINKGYKWVKVQLEGQLQKKYSSIWKYLI